MMDTHVTGVTASSTVPYRIGVLRDAANVADTLANDVSFVGLMLRRAS